MNETIRLIFKETYLFYTKWKSISNPADWSTLMQEARELNEKYPYPLCRRILLELVEIIEAEFMEKG
jgi:hypothetical protein